MQLVAIGETPVHVQLEGDIDLTSAPDVCDRLAAAARLDTGVLIDLRDVTFIDSIGIGVLAQAVRHGADIEVRGAPPKIQRAIELSGLIDPVEL